MYSRQTHRQWPAAPLTTQHSSQLSAGLGFYTSTSTYSKSQNDDCMLCCAMKLLRGSNGTSCAIKLTTRVSDKDASYGRNLFLHTNETKRKAGNRVSRILSIQNAGASQEEGFVRGKWQSNCRATNVNSTISFSPLVNCKQQQHSPTLSSNQEHHHEALRELAMRACSQLERSLLRKRMYARRSIVTHAQHPASRGQRDSISNGNTGDWITVYRAISSCGASREAPAQRCGPRCKTERNSQQPTSSQSNVHDNSEAARAKQRTASDKEYKEAFARRERNENRKRNQTPA